MRGNVSKVSPKVIQGPDGPKGDTPSIIFKYDAANGDLYFSSDGILADKDYVESQNLVLKDDVPQYAQFVINFDSNFIGDKTFEEIKKAYDSGKEIIGVQSNRIYRFSVCILSSTTAALVTPTQNKMYLLKCSKADGWMPVHEIIHITRDEYNQGMEGVERKSNKTSTISASANDTEYPTAKAVFDHVKQKLSAVKINTATEITDAADDNHYPTAKATKNYVDSALSDVSSEAFIITLTPNDGKWVGNRSYEEMCQAIDDGKTIIGIIQNRRMICLSAQYNVGMVQLAFHNNSNIVILQCSNTNTWSKSEAVTFTNSSTPITNASNDTQYPSALAVYNFVTDTVSNDIERIIQETILGGEW